MPWSMSGILTCCANTIKPMHRSKAKPGDGRSHEPADEKASWRSGLLLVANGCSPSHGSSGSMIWALLFDIWPGVSPFLRGLPEPARASADHRLALTRDVLEPGTFLSCRGEGFKPTLDFQVFTEAWAIDVFNVIVANGELGPSGGDRAPGQGFPACVVQQFHRGRIIQMLHEIDLGELHYR